MSKWKVVLLIGALVTAYCLWEPVSMILVFSGWAKHIPDWMLY